MDHADWSNLFQMQTTRGRSLLESVAADELRRNVPGPQVRLRLRGSAISEIRYSSESSWRWQFVLGPFRKPPGSGIDFFPKGATRATKRLVVEDAASGE